MLAAQRAGRTSRHLHGVAALLLYTGLSALLFGLRALPHLGTTFPGRDLGDLKFFVWVVEWWPHAIAHGLNPFLPRVVSPPNLNLAWSASIPAPSLAMAPVTAIFGPVASYNVLVLLGPALSAWSAFLLCRYLTKAFWPSIVGGFFFGFAYFELGQTATGHLQLTLVFVIPFLASLVLRRLHGNIRRGPFLASLTAALTFQFLVYTEYFLTATIVGALLLSLWILLAPRGERRPLVTTVKEIGLSYVLTGLLVSPYLAYVFSHIPPRAFVSASSGSADLLAPLVPTSGPSGRWMPHGWVAAVARFPVEGSSRPYMGILLIGIALYVCSRTIRTRASKLLVVLLVGAVVATWGPTLHVAGHRAFSLPWRALWTLPLLRNVVPTRLGVFAFLAAGILVALWLTTDLRGGWYRWGAAILAAALLLTSNPGTAPLVQAPPPFIRDGLYARVLHPDDLVVMLPYDHNLPMALQAESRMHFRLLNGYSTLLSGFASMLEPESHPGPAVTALSALRSSALPRRRWSELRRLFRAQGVTAILVYSPVSPAWEQFLASLPARARRVGGVSIYRLAREVGARGGT